VNFVDAIQSCFVKYASFNGCASRSEFWWQLLYFFPVIGWVVLIFFCAEPTQPNRYA